MSLLADATQDCRDNKILGNDQVLALVEELVNPNIDEAIKAEFLVALKQKGESAQEVAAFAQAFLPKAKSLPIQGTWDGKALLDCCGTGGGGLNIVNISTGSMFIMAAAGIPVLKHGNKGITKKSGSSDVLVALGLKVDSSPEEVEQSLEKAGLAFIFAPAWHPAFKEIGPLRMKLAQEGHRTVFNLLGPMLNPAQPATQLMGVFQKEHLALFNEALVIAGRDRHLIVYGKDGDSDQPLGEVSARGITQGEGTFGEDSFYWEDVANGKGSLEELKVSSSEESAKRIVAVLQGEENGLLRDMLLRNAAVGLWVQGKSGTLEGALKGATEALDSGEAFKRLELSRS